MHRTEKVNFFPSHGFGYQDNKKYNQPEGNSNLRDFISEAAHKNRIKTNPTATTSTLKLNR
jgi:hypothetical protein